MGAKFITLEGIDGAGKSTHMKRLGEFLRARGLEVMITREPGGTELGEEIRNLVLHKKMHAETETLLMFAARREHLDKVILPALAGGTWVLSDRFTDASFAYQGGGRKVAQSKLKALQKWVHGTLQPDLTFLFDVPLEVAAARLRGTRDKFEREEKAFFRKVRAAYLKRAARFPERIRVIDSTRPLDEVIKELEDIIISNCL